MPRSDLHVLIALTVLANLVVAFGSGLMIGASDTSSDQRYQAYRYASDKPIEVDMSAAAQSGPDTLKYRIPCDNPKGQSESDLCAQWQSANAAEGSAFWAMWSFWAGVAGSGLLVWQIILTRRAVTEAVVSTEAMREANTIAILSQRPWLKIDLTPSDGGYSERGFSFWGLAEIKNTGYSNAIINSFGYRYSRISDIFNLDYKELEKLEFRNYSGLNHKTISMPGSLHNEHIFTDINWDGYATSDSQLDFQSSSNGLLKLLEIEVKYGWERNKDQFFTRWMFVVGAAHPEKTIALLRYRKGDERQLIKTISLGCSGAA